MFAGTKAELAGFWLPKNTTWGLQNKPIGRITDMQPSAN